MLKEFREFAIKGNALDMAVGIIIGLLTQSRFIYLAGLAPPFPTLSVIAHSLAFRQGGPPAVTIVAWFVILSILPYLAYLLAMVLLIDRLGFGKTLLAALGVWLAAAAFIVVLWNRTPLHRLFL